MKQFFTLAVTVMVLLTSGMQNAQAELVLDIRKGHFKPMPIAIPNITGGTAEMQDIGRKITGVVSADLERSGLFHIVDKRAFMQTVDGNFVSPNYALWRQINADALVTGKAYRSSPGKMKVAFRLWDSHGESQLVGKELGGELTAWRRVAHLIADEIYSRITGEKGYFDSRVVYVAESGNAKRRVKRLAIMDQDGANHKFITDGRDLVLTPRFSPNSQEILYMSYKGGRPRVYLRDLQTGREEPLGSFKGMSFAPRFNHDGTKMVMSIAHAGNTEVYQMDLRSRKLQRLTRSSGIDTSPSYSPDGSRIVFNSDRGGSQQLYVMNANGSGTKRISFGDGRYGTPVWSPRQDMIAFTKMRRGRFYIGVMRPDGSGERLLTESWLDEGPTWSPNGRVIMFGRQSGPRGRAQLYSVDITGNNLRRVGTPLNASDPAWSPLLPM